MRPMDVSHILDGLNDAQREAVTAPPGPMLILAGAGSGKTRVLVHRMAWLIQVEEVSPFSVMAVTFTNKAAAEMRSRVEQLQGVSPNGMWVGTFHGIAHRLLRAHWKEAGLPQQFQILDSDDQFRMIKRVLKSLELDEARWVPRQIQGFINGRKDEGLRPQHVNAGSDPIRQQLVAIYSAYEAACKRAGVIDFAELLLRCLELIRDNKDLNEHYRRRFKHILVDEFQDTNEIQYAWIQLLSADPKAPGGGGTGAQLFVVGDDDQAIYGWRGAKVENILSFKHANPNTLIIKLEQNYRSTGNILNAANGLIAHNEARMGKSLWTDGDDGNPIQLYAAFNEQEEARYVIDRITEHVSNGNARTDIAILYRSNAQSRVFEEQLMMQSIPYRVYGGLRFFERAEIRDALSYLRLVNNRNDDPAFERVVNQPTRGIGNKTVDTIREAARLADISMWAASLDLIANGGLTARAQNALNGFIQLITKLHADTEAVELHEQFEHVIHASGLIDHYGKEKGEKAEARVENLEELVSAAKGFEYEQDDEAPLDTLTAFLTHAALEAGEGQAEAWEDCVQLMTLHSAKGLEFPLVFMVGMEEGLFPHARSAEEEGRLQEERRLCYVGITRARDQLVLSYAEQRRLYGKEMYPMPSSFIGEIPAQFIEEIRPKTHYSANHFSQQTSYGYAQQSHDSGLNIGQRVMHPKFGEGVLLNYEGQGKSARVEVNFDQVGSKWLVLSYANLQTL
ncbi:ATP-dependent DNA helicase UvrD/PcrA [hydrothermal vent metagenome]|uniref:DNA 3'-5' helicase n=1 Tax=hydrothermal vent metagenome TaxID=652676 RepID=A0A3B0XDU6_9ZZZZ